MGSNFNLVFMKILDNLISKIGNDKVLHFLGGAWICALVTFVTILQEDNLNSLEKVGSVLIGTVVVIILSVIKELIMDEEADWMDVLAAVTGCITIFTAVALGAWFNSLS